MEEDGELVAGVIQNHLNAISSLLSFYERHLWNFVTPSAKRTRQIVEIQLVKAQAVMMYQLSGGQLQAIKARIAGMDKAQATDNDKDGEKIAELIKSIRPVK